MDQGAIMIVAPQPRLLLAGLGDRLGLALGFRRAFGGRCFRRLTAHIAPGVVGNLGVGNRPQGILVGLLLMVLLLDLLLRLGRLIRRKQVDVGHLRVSRSGEEDEQRRHAKDFHRRLPDISVTPYTVSGWTAKSDSASRRSRRVIQ